MASRMTHVRAQTEALTHEEIRRYSRHLIVPEVGVEGQKRLKGSSILMIGVGGLGSPMALYFAAAGVGRIGLVDFDAVDKSNLQRQVIHTMDAVGMLKVESAKARILSINPLIQVDVYPYALTSKNACEILASYDVIVDGADNFATRYLVNDACVLLGKPNVHGSIFRFDGHVSVFHAKQGPCYRCLYPEPPPPGLVPSCAEGGVLGVLPGVIGTIQATEAIKLIIGKGKPLIGRLLRYDALETKFSVLPIRKDPSCAMCSASPSITELVDYPQSCGTVLQRIGTQRNNESKELEITPTALKMLLDQDQASVVVIDVREPHEWEISRLPFALLISKDQFIRRLSELDPSKHYVVHCKSGMRSMEVAILMVAAGFQVQSLRGGINAWANEVDTSLATY